MSSFSKPSSFLITISFSRFSASDTDFWLTACSMILWMWRISWLIFIFTLIAIVSSWHLTDSRSLLTSPNSFWSCALWSLESSHNYNQINKYCHDPSPRVSNQLQSILTNIKSPNPTFFFRNLETQDSRLESRILT